MTKVKRYSAALTHAETSPMCEALDGEWVVALDFDRVTAERDALQQRLNATDQRIDELISAVRSINHAKHHEVLLPGDDEPQYPQRKEWVDWILGLCDEPAPQPEMTMDDDWHMNPCKQGHRDVGAAGGVAACNQCDEKIEAATTQEAFERWNATHPQQ